MPSSQGTTVSFAGSSIGSLLQVTVDAGTAVTAETTSVTSASLGSGTSTRIRKQRECTAVDPGGVTLRLLGDPPFTASSVGMSGTVSFSCSGASLTAQAILEKFEIECSVGDFVRSSVSFVFTGS